MVVGRENEGRNVDINFQITSTKEKKWRGIMVPSHNPSTWELETEVLQSRPAWWI